MTAKFQKLTTDVCGEDRGNVAVSVLKDMNSRTLIMVRNLGCFSVRSPIKAVLTGDKLLKETSKKTFGAC